MKTRVDLNADAGESLGRWKLGHDSELMAHVTSVNVACGFHASDPVTMRESVRTAAATNTAIGSHPGLPDLVGFGRRRMALRPDEAAQLVLYQTGALQATARAEGAEVVHVKPHGALYGMALTDPDITSAITEAVLRLDPDLLIFWLAGPTAELARSLGATVAREGFADLEYTDEGHIIVEPEPKPKDPDAVAQQAVDLLEGHVTSTSGKRLEVEVDTICLHGDRPNAVEIADRLVARLDDLGVERVPAVQLLRA
jgi:5-oxoprolinase (ATP-hydrolysing) subunit A